MSKFDPMGDRLKAYEAVETSRKCELGKPICVRLDGKAFHTFTKGLIRPYDKRLSNIMIETTKYLVEETHACIGYTQSDEITLIFYYDEPSTPLFGGKFHKLTSLLAGLCSSKFAKLVQDHLPEKKNRVPYFDARVFQVPSKTEASNVLLWRWFDAKKNSVSMLAQSIFSHKELQNKDTHMMRQMCLDYDYDWEQYPEFFKWGTFLQRKTREKELTEEELLSIPEKFRPDGKVQRSHVEVLNMPAFNKIKNRVEVIFESADPELANEG